VTAGKAESQFLVVIRRMQLLEKRTVVALLLTRMIIAELTTARTELTTAKTAGKKTVVQERKNRMTAPRTATNVRTAEERTVIAAEDVTTEYGMTAEDGMTAGKIVVMTARLTDREIVPGEMMIMTLIVEEKETDSVVEEKEETTEIDAVENGARI